MFLADYAVLDGIRGVRIDGRPTFLCAPMCLLHLGGDGGMRPVAIQVGGGQKKGGRGGEGGASVGVGRCQCDPVVAIGVTE